MEKLNYTPKKPETQKDIEIVLEHGGGVQAWELENWKKLYPKLNVRATLEKVADLMAYIYDNHPDIREGNDDDPEGEWDGKLFLWGFKREIMKLLDPERENNEYFKSLPEDLQNKIREIKLEDCIKE